MEKMNEEDTATAEPFAAPELAKGLEKTQIGRYHTKGGISFAAEDANAFANRIRGKQVEVTGTSHEKDGADRIVDGVPIQTKYFSSASPTVENALDGTTGEFRYEGQQLEVPKDQYNECVRIMRDKISAGKVPGVTDPNEAERIVRKGDVTYKQARNIARAGNIDSLLFDAKTQCITTGYVFAVTFAVHFAKRKWNGDKTEDAINGAIESAIAAGGSTLVTGILAAQVLRTRAAALGVVAARNGVKAVSTTSVGKKAIERLAQASLGKAVYGAAAINRVAKLLRSNVITSTIATAVTSTPDFCRAAFSKSISWPQFTKSVVVNAGGVAAGAGGWMGGAAAGAAIGSAVPIIGTAAGGIIGGILGALGGGWLGTATTKGVMDVLIEDDAKRMVELLQVALEELAGDYLLSEAEIEEFGQTIKATVNPKWLRSMYQAEAGADSDAARQQFTYDAFDQTCQDIVAKRQKIELPAPEQVQAQIVKIADTVAPIEDMPETVVAVPAT
jgi:hypothetical protein